MNRSKRFRRDPNARDPRPAPPDEAYVFWGHAGQSFAGQWNPIHPIVATAGADSTVRLWDLSIKKQQKLHHCLERSGTEVLSNKAVASVDWNASGSHLVTGSYDGHARIWTKNGQQTNRLGQNIGAIFEAKWNKTENYILCAGNYGTSVWDVSTQSTKRFSFHDAQVMDIDWREDDTFASCGKDGKVFVCSVNEEKPVRSFLEHTGEVNAVMWNNRGNYLASCSDDKTIKVWGIRRNEVVHNLTGHMKQVYIVKWSPIGAPNNLILASGSYDATARIWDFLRGECLHVLKKHLLPVETIDFRDDGKLLATGSWDKYICIWSAESGRLVQSYKCSSGVNKVTWNPSGTTIAACTWNGNIVILDVRKF